MKGPLNSSFLSCEETSDGRGADAGDTTVLPCSCPYNSKLHNSAEDTVLNFLSKETSHNPTTPTLLTRPRWKEDRNHTLASFLTKFRGSSRDQSREQRCKGEHMASRRRQRAGRAGTRLAAEWDAEVSALGAGAKAARRAPHLPGRGGRQRSGRGHASRLAARPSRPVPQALPGRLGPRAWLAPASSRGPSRPPGPRPPPGTHGRLRSGRRGATSPRPSLAPGTHPAARRLLHLLLLPPLGRGSGSGSGSARRRRQ